jgi:hypothetical protein
MGSMTPIEQIGPGFIADNKGKFCEVDTKNEARTCVSTMVRNVPAWRDGTASPPYCL